MTDMEPFREIGERLYAAAKREGKIGELFYCLFDGGMATVDEDGRLILVSGEATKDFMERAR